MTCSGRTAARCWALRPALPSASREQGEGLAAPSQPLPGAEGWKGDPGECWRSEVAEAPSAALPAASWRKVCFAGFTGDLRARGWVRRTRLLGPGVFPGYAVYQEPDPERPVREPRLLGKSCSG